MSDITMSFEELSGILADYVQIGYMTAIRAYDPAQDEIRLADVRKWLRMMRVDEKTFHRLESAGHIRPSRRGTGRNSPLYYSKTAIVEALKAAKVSLILTASEISRKTNPKNLPQ